MYTVFFDTFVFFSIREYLCTLHKLDENNICHLKKDIVVVHLKKMKNQSDASVGSF